MAWSKNILSFVVGGGCLFGERGRVEKPKKEIWADGHP